MAKTETRIAILGAGPIGLEAGLYARELGLPFTIYERGRLAEHVMRWGHVKLFSPFGMNVTALGRAAIVSQRGKYEFPAEDACITGREFVAQYLLPAAEAITSHLQTETLVLRLGRKGFLKNEAVNDPQRGKAPFRLLVRDRQNRERFEEADVVLDCTGSYGQHRWLGEGGIPALGELAAEPQIAYGLEDILGDRKNVYANKNILLIGGGYSAATTACNLAKLAEETTSTWTIWIGRGAGTTPMKRIPADPLKERDRLASRANNLACRDDDNVEYHAQTVVDAVEFLGQDRGFKVATRSAGKPRVWEVERVIANVGYTPDTALFRELQIHECYATLGPMKLAAALGGNKNGDCLKQTACGPETLRNPEPNFYILGAKSYGRNSNFLLRVGHEQVREVFSLITGKTDLDLYKSRK